MWLNYLSENKHSCSCSHSFPGTVGPVRALKHIVDSTIYTSSSMVARPNRNCFSWHSNLTPQSNIYLQFFYMVCWILQIATSCNIGHIHTFQAHKFFNSCHDPSLRDGRDVSQPFHEGQQNVCHVFGRVKPGRPHHWQHDEQSGKNQIAAKCCKPCPQESFGFKGRKPVLILTFITFISFSFIRIVSQSATP